MYNIYNKKFLQKTLILSCNVIFCLYDSSEKLHKAFLFLMVGLIFKASGEFLMLSSDRILFSRFTSYIWQKALFILLNSACMLSTPCSPYISRPNPNFLKNQHNDFPTNAFLA